MTTQTAEAIAGFNNARERFVAFVADEPNELLVKNIIGEMALPFSSVLRGNVIKAIAYLQQTRSPSALMVDISGVEFPVNFVQQLADVCEPGVSVIIIGDRNDVGLYRDLMATGVSDYFVKPLIRPLIQAAIETMLGLGKVTPRKSTSQKLGQLVTVLGARGGVGVTMISSNLAWHLAYKENRRVALVDLDLFFGNCALALDVKPGSGLREVLENPSRLDDLFLERAMLRSGDKLHILASEENLDTPFRPDPSALEPLFMMLRRQFHYVVVDVPRRSNAFVRDAVGFATTSVLVVDQTAQSIRDGLRIRTFLKGSETNQRSIMVMNRYGEAGAESIALRELATSLDMTFQVTIPYSPKTVMVAANAGLPVVAERGPVATAIASLSAELSGRPLERKRPWWKPKS